MTTGNCQLCVGRLGRCDERMVNRSLELNPVDALPAYFYRGKIKVRMNLKGGGCTDFEKAKELGFEEAGNYLIKYCK